MRAHETPNGVYCPGCSYRLLRWVPDPDDVEWSRAEWPKGWIWDREAEMMVRRRSRHGQRPDGVQGAPLAFIRAECPRCREVVELIGGQIRPRRPLPPR